MKGLQEARFVIESAGLGMLQSNVRLANPRDPYAMELKRYTAKRKKTEEDFLEISRLEWYGGLYSEDDRVIVPSIWIEIMMRDAARKTKQGKNYEPALHVFENPKLIYDGPQDIDKLWEDGRFTDMRTVVVSSRRVMRTRPYFPKWRLEFSMHYIPSVLDYQDIVEKLNTAGLLIGLSTYRPRHGKFEVVSSEMVKA